MINNTSLSGVIFTKDRDTGANYYSINYDDVTGLTNTVTSGQGKFSNKTLFIYRSAYSQIRSERFKTLISAVKNLEKKVNDDNLDIEFCLTKNLTPYLLQVRKITLNNNLISSFTSKLDKELKKIETRILPKFKRDMKISGKTTIFGQMPDWNPVEMIGKHPSKLAYSLYSEIITKKIWAKARDVMGYKNLSDYNLMTNFGGQPFIDVRLSLNSFLPNKLKKNISEKLVNYSIKKLILNPMYHDKIEFDISITNYSFDFEKRFKKVYGNILDKNEKKIFIDEIKSLTIKNVSIRKSSSLNKALLEIEKLKRIQSLNKKYNIHDLGKIISECKNFGTLPFSILARHAFIATDLLNSLHSIGILTKNDIENFRSSLSSITSEMLEDANKLSKKLFLEKYGHLRPGTYDIKSSRYDQISKDFFLKNNSNNFLNKKLKSEKIFNLQNYQTKINKYLDNRKFELDAEKLFNYFEKSITLREYAKFIFTKSISIILEKIKIFSKKNQIPIDDIEFLEISDFFENNTKKKIINKIKRNKNEYLYNQSIKLPEIIVDETNMFVGASVVSVPNFITYKLTEGNVIYLNSKKKNLKIKNKIVLIENADPGYDWIFSHNIKGLITKYGGANSHMTIRCNELEIPAAIGCGETLFSKIENTKKLLLNCKNKIIKII